MSLKKTEILFLGDGTSQNYKQIDVANKLLVIAPEINSKTEELLDIAYQKGAKFVFTIFQNTKEFSISEELKHYVEQDKLVFNGEKKTTINTSIAVTLPMTAKLFNCSKAKLKKVLKKEVITSENMLKGIVDFTIAVKKTTLKTENVVALLESDSSSKEVVVLSAHYDHIGMKGDVIYNGADDDGSGTVTLLEMAQAFSKAKKNGFAPKRNILFIAMTGEEKGLLGSEFYTKHPIFDLKNTIVNLNIDMIGRVDTFHNDDDSNYVYLIGTDMISKELHRVSQEVSSLYSDLFLDYKYNSLDDPNRFYYRSDHYNFAKNNVPVIFYFTGVHADYHKPTDTVDKIMFGKIEKIARLVFYTAWELANRTNKVIRSN